MIVVWLALSTLAAVVAWAVLVAVLVVAGWIIATPALRPTGWATTSLVGVNKLALLVLAGAWLILVMFMERDLRLAQNEGRLTARTFRYLLFFAAVALPCVLLILV